MGGARDAGWVAAGLVLGAGACYCIYWLTRGPRPRRRRLRPSRSAGEAMGGPQVRGCRATPSWVGRGCPGRSRVLVSRGRTWGRKAGGCLGWVRSRFPAPTSLFKIRAENIAPSFLLFPRPSPERTKVSPSRVSCFKPCRLFKICTGPLCYQRDVPGCECVTVGLQA